MNIQERQEVKLEPRQIEIYDIELLNINKTEKQIFRVQCSKELT
ncbi:MAG: hypothetical protein ACLU2J_05595 [Clostridia bacterium]